LQTPIAQAAALTIFGNDVLRGGSSEDFWPGSTVFSFCRSVTFATLGGPTDKVGERPFAEHPLQWIAKLQVEGAVGCRLQHITKNNSQISDRMSAAFVGSGGRWLIEAVRPARSDLWEARWEVVDRNAPDKKIWGVKYYRVAEDRPKGATARYELSTLRGELDSMLSKLEAFANRQALPSFAAAFSRGIELLHVEAPLASVYHSDLARHASISLDAQRLLGAAQAAWVFGGMGSWNDQGFAGQDQAEYEALSDRLFALLNLAIVAAVNSGFPDGV
jgi:hypothetical protein